MVEGKCQSIWRVVQRKRVVETERRESKGLRRCLNSWDLTALGVGRTLGIGVYVLIGGVALNTAGPSIVLSFLIAAIMALLAGLCYAEFGVRIPLAGSSFIYTYLTLGELLAFIVGWTNILELVFGSASIARGVSAYIDLASNNSMSTWFLQTVPLSLPLLSPYFDLFSFFLVLLIGILLAVGVRESSLVNTVICGINILFILIIIIAGSVAADSANWSVAVDQIPPDQGDGGFFPYGVWGTLKGAAVCFYCFVGFDVVNAAAEEVKNPRYMIPTAILFIISCVFVVYAALSVVLTMMVPYYDIAATVSVASAFTYVGWSWAWWIVVIGAFFGLTTSLFGVLFPLPRLLYSMASDGLFFHWFAKVHTSRQSPIIATVIPTIVIAILSGLLDLEQLVLMLCIGTLASYTIVAACVVLLRHRSNKVSDIKGSFMKQMIGCGNRKATRTTKRIIDIGIIVYICLCIAISIVCTYTSRPLVAMIILHVLAILNVVIMALQPSNDEDLAFKTPLVPFLPCLSIYANIHLMVVISWQSWVRVLIWILIGIPIYLICLWCYKQKASKTIDGINDNEIIEPYANNNGKQSAVQIVVESPTPPNTLARMDNYEDQQENISSLATVIPLNTIVDTNKTEQIMIQQIQIENNEEKEAKIIDLLDQVLQAEEDSYGEVISLKEIKEETGIPHRKSLSELSDAGSDASLGNQVLSKYDVIAQVHREDLPKVREEEEIIENIVIPAPDYEDITAFNESDTNSRTDESGYSDTLGTSTEGINTSNIPVPPPLPPFDENYFQKSPRNFGRYNTIAPEISKENVGQTRKTSEVPIPSNIPVPPPFDEDYFKQSSPRYFGRYNTIAPEISKENVDQTGKTPDDSDTSNIPVPPPFDEDYFATPIRTNFKKYNTISPRLSKTNSEADDDSSNEPRTSVLSNNSQGDGNMRFGSSRQLTFMSKLNNIFQKTLDAEDEEPRKRSHSTGNVTEAELAVAASRERPQMFFDLKKELLARDSLPNLKPVYIEVEKPPEPEPEPIKLEVVVDDKDEEENGMNRKELRSKLESIFAVSGAQLAKPRLMKTNSSTPEEPNSTDQSSTESIPKPPKSEKFDTLKRQKERFGHVLNSLVLTVNKDDAV